MQDSVSNQEDHNITMEMATVCSPKTYKGGNKCRVYIQIHGDDHANNSDSIDKQKFLGDGITYLPDSKSPAHAHVTLSLSDKSSELGLLNITGFCPKNRKDIVEYRKPSPSKMAKYYDDIVLFANSVLDTGDTGWETLRKVWLKANSGKNPNNVTIEEDLGSCRDLFLFTDYISYFYE